MGAVCWVAAEKGVGSKRLAATLRSQRASSLASRAGRRGAGVVGNCCPHFFARLRRARNSYKVEYISRPFAIIFLGKFPEFGFARTGQISKRISINLGKA